LDKIYIFDQIDTFDKLDIFDEIDIFDFFKSETGRRRRQQALS
jgi:hypothetical protein